MITPGHKQKDIRKHIKRIKRIKHKHKAVMVDRLVLMLSTRTTEHVRFSCAYAYAYVVGVLTCFTADYADAYACAYACENQP